VRLVIPHQGFDVLDLDLHAGGRGRGFSM
jgi:hypothetical protein